MAQAGAKQIFHLPHRGDGDRIVGISPDCVPKKPDELDDPKRSLLTLAARSRSSRLRADLIPAPGSTAAVGPDYNNQLSGFIRTDWNVFEAEKNSESLRRAVVRIRELAELLHNKE